MAGATRGAPWAALTGIMGLAAFSITVAFSQLPAVKTAGSCMASGALMTFELTRSPAVLQHIFHPAGDPSRPLALAAMAAAVIAFAADYVETVTLLTITKDLHAGQALLGRSSLAAWTKFGALAAHALLLASVCLTSVPRRLVLGSLLLLPAAAYVLMCLAPSRQAVLTLAFVASWVPLTLAALWTAFGSKSRSAAPAAA